MTCTRISDSVIICHEPDAPPMPSRGLERRRRIIDRLREDGVRLTQVFRGHQLRRMQAAGKAYLAMMERTNDGSWAMGWALSSIYECLDPAVPRRRRLRLGPQQGSGGGESDTPTIFSTCALITRTA